MTTQEDSRPRVMGTAIPNLRSVRRGLFTLVAGVTLALAALMMRAELLLAFTGWFEDLGVHQVHDMTIFGLLWVTIVVPMVLALYRPARRVNTALAPVLFLVPMAVFTALVSSPLLMLPVIFGTLALLALSVHPAGRGLLRFDRVDQVPRPLAVLLVIAAVPLLSYAGGQALLQLTVTDEHAFFAHYGGMAIAATYVVLMGALALLRRRDFRFAAWSAGLVAVIIGAASITFSVASSVGVGWGALLIVWAIVFVAGVEYSRNSVASTDDDSTDETVAEPA